MNKSSQKQKLKADTLSGVHPSRCHSYETWTSDRFKKSPSSSDCSHFNTYLSNRGLCWYYTKISQFFKFRINGYTLQSPLQGLWYAPRFQSTDSISKVTPACADSTAHRSALSGKQQNTQDRFAQPWSSPLVYGPSENQLIITSDCHQIKSPTMVSDKQTTASVTFLTEIIDVSEYLSVERLQKVEFIQIE